MKYFNKLMVFFLFLLFNYGADIFAYTYKIANMTGEDVQVRFYWSSWSELTNHPHLIKAGSTDTLRFGGSKALLCLTRIMVNQKRLNGSWGRAKKAKIGSIKKKDLRDILIASAATAGGIAVAGAIAAGTVAIGAVALGALGYGIYYGIDTSRCRDRNYTLVIHPKTAEVEAIYVR